MKKVVLFFSVFLIFNFCYSQKNVIKGFVYDKLNGSALPGANVVVENTYVGSFSSTDGSFEFSVKSGFPLTLLVSFIGYETDSVVLNSPTSASIRIELTPKAFVSDEIVVKSIRIGSQDATSFSNINAKSIEKINIGTDMPVMLNALPSVTTTSDAGAGIGYTAFRLRGTDQSRINVTINGVPYNDPESHDVYWVDVPDLASSSENIQVQRGVGTSTNGSSSFGGSINIFTHSLKADPFASFIFRYGSFNTIGTTALFGTGLMRGQWVVDGRVSLLHSDGYIDRATSDIKSFQSNIAWYGDKTLVRFMLLHGKEKTYQAWEGVPKDSLKTNRTYNPYSYENEIDLYQQNHYHLVVSNQFTRKWSSTATAFLVTGNGYYEQYKEDKEFSDYLLPNLIIGSDTITSTDLVRRKMMDNKFYGIVFSANYDSYKKVQLNFGGNISRYDGDHFGNVIWMKYAGNSKINHEFYRNNGLKDDISAYYKIRYALAKNTVALLDLQVRNISYKVRGDEDDKKNILIDKSFLFFNPKASIVHNFKKHSIYLYGGIAGREPNRYMMVDADSGKMPTPEILFDVESGYKYATEKWNANINLYYMHYKDQLVQTGEINDIGSPVFVNVPRSYRLGIEGIWAWKINNKLDFEGNATYSINKIKDLVIHVDDWDTYVQREEFYKNADISFSPSVVGSAILGYNVVKNLRLTLSGKYVGKQYLDNTSSEDRMLHAYKVFDFAAEYKIAPRGVKEISFKLILKNIFSEDYESNAWVYRYYYGGQHYVLDGYFPQAYFNFLGSVAVKF